MYPPKGSSQLLIHPIKAFRLFFILDFIKNILITVYFFNLTHNRKIISISFFDSQVFKIELK